MKDALVLLTVLLGLRLVSAVAAKAIMEVGKRS